MQFYEREADLVAGVGAYLIEARREAAVSVVIATEAHRDAFTEHLRMNGLDTVAAEAEGTLLMLDATATLQQFMPRGRIDRGAFFDVIGGVIRDAAKTGRPVRAYGEMVALLWDAGDVLAVIDLERLWNELAGELPFSLYCAYHSDSVAGHEHADALHEVCNLHAAAVPVPGDSAEVTAEFPVDASAAGEVRRLVADAVRRWGHDRSVIDDAQIVATELAANAILHAGTRFHVSVHRFGPMVRIAMQDGATALPAILGPDPMRFSGRGMHLIGRISRRWGVEVTGEGKTVWAELGR